MDLATAGLRFVGLVPLAMALHVTGAPAATKPCDSSARASFRAGPAHTGVFCSDAPAKLAGLRWTFDAHGPVRSTPVIASGLVLVGSGDGNLYALDAETGREAWKLTTGGPVDSSPAVARCTVFFASRDRKVYAADVRSGRLKWTFSTGEELPFPWGYEHFISSPVADGRSVFIGAGDGILYCLSAEDGGIRWQVRTGGRIRSSPALSGGTVYVGSMDGFLYAVDALGGRTRWRFETEGATIDSIEEGYDRRSINSSPAVANGVVTFGSRDGHQYAVDAETGRRLWRFGHPVDFVPGSPDVGWVESSPAISGDTTYVGSSDGRFVNAVDLATGKERWRFPTPSRVLSSVAVAGPTVVFGGSDGSVYAVDAVTGLEVWRFPTRDGVHSSPVAWNGMVFVGSDDGTLYALSGKRPGPALLPWKAVYWDERLREVWFTGGKALRDSLVAAGYRELNAHTLAGFLSDRIEDGTSSTVVFAGDVAPMEITEAGLGKTPLVRRFLEAGGRIVWLSGPPFAATYDRSTWKINGFSSARTRRILGVSRERLSPADPSEVGARATPDGLAWGLPAFGIASWPVDPKDVTTVLGTDPTGLATAWIKSFGKPGSGLVQWWGREKAIPDPSIVRRLAEHAF